jgi:hypothetical protein
MLRIPVVASVMLLLLTALPAAHGGEFGVQVGFSDREISTIQAYYRDHDSASRGGNNKAGKGGKGLPPGIAKNLQRGKPLPPGIAKQTLPSGLLAMLPPPPKGFERIEIAGKVLLVEIATQVIHDVLEDVVFRR